jgi:hypothetical protein
MIWQLYVNQERHVYESAAKKISLWRLHDSVVFINSNKLVDSHESKHRKCHVHHGAKRHLSKQDAMPYHACSSRPRWRNLGHYKSGTTHQRLPLGVQNTPHSAPFISRHERYEVNGKEMPATIYARPEEILTGAWGYWIRNVY